MNTDTNLAANRVCNTVSALFTSMHDLNHAVVADDSIAPNIKIQFVLEMNRLFSKVGRVQEALIKPLDMIDE